MKRFICIFCISVLFLFSMQSQNTFKSRVGFSYESGNYPVEITENLARSLENKVNQIISRNCAGASIASSAIFVIRPEFFITSSNVVNAGMRDVHAVKGEITLYAAGILDGNIYASLGVFSADEYTAVVHARNGIIRHHCGKLGKRFFARHRAEARKACNVDFILFARFHK